MVLLSGGHDMTSKTQLDCACCGGVAGKWAQFPNQDKGFGLCANCADWILERDKRKPPGFRTDLTACYGKAGVHREPGPRLELCQELQARRAVSATAPESWAPYLINGDAEGLSSDEKAAADSFVEFLGAAPCSCEESGFLWRPDSFRFWPYGAQCCTFSAMIEQKDSPNVEN